ncbi:hypothetical protein BDZ94DRAFT_1007295 [Collybia nuda]|uniref:Uncharacterized protein n=1 Tax=Collybia nuda TaxID=64659 RepID=A0A9P5Y1F2_9AGAR|nr:hypothetical protein BDZ94DRAFT_1007295 [Collybia nuda]
MAVREIDPKRRLAQQMGMTDGGLSSDTICAYNNQPYVLGPLLLLPGQQEIRLPVLEILFVNVLLFSKVELQVQPERFAVRSQLIRQTTDNRHLSLLGALLIRLLPSPFILLVV